MRLSKQQHHEELLVWSIATEHHLNVCKQMINTIKYIHLLQSGSICLDSIYESNRSVLKLFLLDWHTFYQMSRQIITDRKYQKN